MKHGAAVLLILGLTLGTVAYADPVPAAPAPSAPAPAPTPTPTAGAAASAIAPVNPADLSPAPFLWAVKGGSVTHYLLGSVHLLPKLAHPLPAALEDAYAKADTLVFESDLGALDAPDMQRAVLAAARSQTASLRDDIPPELYARVQAHARRDGLPDNVCDPYAAWFCAMTFEIFSLRQLGFDAALGLDQHFYERALGDNKAIAWFEAPARHLQLFTDMNAEVARRFLAATLDEDDKPDQRPAALLKAWLTGDIAFIDQLDVDFKRDYPAVYDRLLAARNRAWLPNLAARLHSPDAQMIIVGAAHLVGPDGLVNALRQRGFDVQYLGAMAATRGEAPAAEAPGQAVAPSPAPAAAPHP
jgi:uncharacterized protein YbaP (TraB family)